MTSSMCPVSACLARLEGEALYRFRGHVSGPGRRIPVNKDADHDGPVFVPECGPQSVAQVARFLDVDAGGAERFGDAAEGPG
jgi:hypothetical protein